MKLVMRFAEDLLRNFKEKVNTENEFAFNPTRSL